MLKTAIAATWYCCCGKIRDLMLQNSGSGLPKRGFPASSLSIPELAAHVIAQRKHDRAASKRVLYCHAFPIVALFSDPNHFTSTAGH